MLNAIVLIAVAAVIVTIVGYLVSSYRKAQGSPWRKLLAGAKNSATVLWQYIVTAGGMVIVFADQAAAYFALPEVQAFIKDHLTPTRVGIAMTVIAVITIIARLRTLRVA